jgi:hypothetical protein
VEQDRRTRCKRRGPDAFAILRLFRDAEVVITLLFAVRRQRHNHARAQHKEENARECNQILRRTVVALGRSAERPRQQDQEDLCQEQVHKRVQSDGPALREARVPNGSALRTLRAVRDARLRTIGYKVRIFADVARRRRQCHDHARAEQNEKNCQDDQDRKVRHHLC